MRPRTFRSLFTNHSELYTRISPYSAPRHSHSQSPLTCSFDRTARHSCSLFLTGYSLISLLSVALDENRANGSPKPDSLTAVVPIDLGEIGAIRGIDRARRCVVAVRIRIDWRAIVGPSGDMYRDARSAKRVSASVRLKSVRLPRMILGMEIMVGVWKMEDGRWTRCVMSSPYIRTWPNLLYTLDSRPFDRQGPERGAPSHLLAFLPR